MTVIYCGVRRGDIDRELAKPENRSNFTGKERSKTMNIKKIILITCAIIISAGMTVSAAGFEYGDNSGLPGLNQFAGEEYVIYQNADNGRIELAVIYADDINDRSLVVEIDGQVEVPGDQEVAASSTGSPAYGPGYGEEIPPLENKRIYLAETQTSYYTVKWYLNGEQWVKFEDIAANQTISEDYEELIYSSVPIVEKINKTKTARSYYRAYSGEYYVDFDRAAGDSETQYYLRFSKDGVNVDKIVEVPLRNNAGIGGAFTGNGITIAMGTPNMALSEYQRPAGFNSGCIYIFDEDCDLIDTVDANGLMNCSGFYNGYFYFTSKIYTAEGEFTLQYIKSADGVNFENITREEYETATSAISQTLYLTSFGTDIDIENDIVYISNVSGGEPREAIYESETVFRSDEKAFYGSLSGYVVKSKWLLNFLGNDYEYITADYVYKIAVPKQDESRPAYLRSNRYAWATDDYIYIDQDVEYILRIPMSQLEDQVYVQLNDKLLGFDQPPVTENDRTLVPMRFLFEQMGAEVVWNDATQTATATVPVTTEEEIQTFGLAEEKSVTFSVDNTTATVNGSAATMDVPARLINDKTMVPLRFLSENLGFNVQWDEATRTAIVTTE